MRKLLIATQNKDKFKEFGSILSDISFEVIFPFKHKIIIPENLENLESGNTFRENAIAKAKAWGELNNLLTLADDSGLCVDYLKRKPGVKSHRFINGSDEDRYQKLLNMMERVPEQKRSATFVSIIAIFDPITKVIKTTKGECKGRIAYEPKGKWGFGYDPIFIIDSLGKHFAQLTPEEKNQVSHRAVALKKMKKILLSFS